MIYDSQLAGNITKYDYITSKQFDRSADITKNRRIAYKLCLKTIASLQDMAFS